MKKKLFTYLVAVTVLFSAFVGMQKASSAWGGMSQKLQIFMRVLDFVKNDYVDKKVDDEKLVYGAIKGMLESLDDPYTRFMEPKPFEEMQIRMQGSYSGIGIHIGIKNNKLTVISPITDTPAYKAGLKSGDTIVAINDLPTLDMGLDEAVSHIRGVRGTEIRLTIVRGKNSEKKEYSMVRDNITVKSVETRTIEKDIAYIKLNTFENMNAHDEMKLAITEAKNKKAKGLILDVRNNGGGLLSNAIDIASMFLQKGDTIVFTVDRDGRKDPMKSLGKNIWTAPIVILINEGSASASEILAGALKDNGVATLVGYHTFGKASVQSVRQLPDKSAVLLTVAKYLTPSGHDISKKGIAPDIEIVTGREKDNGRGDEEYDDIDASSGDKDIQLDKAVETIKRMIK